MQFRARQGSAGAQQLLREADEQPIALVYLAERFWRLHRMREIDPMAGPKPFTVDTLDRAMRVFGWRLEPIEIEALLILDRAALNPGDEA